MGQGVEWLRALRVRVFLKNLIVEYYVRSERLELSRLSAPAPKAGVYTNFTMTAKCIDIVAYD